MTGITSLLQQGSANAWLFVPSAILLGALQGLEPGYSKTMMAALHHLHPQLGGACRGRK